MTNLEKLKKDADDAYEWWCGIGHARWPGISEYDAATIHMHHARKAYAEAYEAELKEKK